MPRYFSDVVETGPADAAAPGPDETGTVLVGLEAVRYAALRFLPEILKDAPKTDIGRRELGLCVRDGGGRTVYRGSLVLRGENGKA